MLCSVAAIPPRNNGSADPIGDGLVILSHLGFAPPIFIHWGTALYMAIVAASLLRRK
jgi:hypothetical protein